MSSKCDCDCVESGRHDRECPASGESVAKGDSLRQTHEVVSDVWNHLGVGQEIAANKAITADRVATLEEAKRRILMQPDWNLSNAGVIEGLIRELKESR